MHRIIYILSFFFICCSFSQANAQTKYSDNVLGSMVEDAGTLRKENKRFRELTEKSKKTNLTSAEEKEYMDIWHSSRCKMHDDEYTKLIKKNAKNISLITFNDKECEKCYIKNEIFFNFCKQHGINCIIMRPIEYMSYVREHNIYDDPLIPSMSEFFDPKTKSNIIAKLKYPVILHYKSFLFESSSTLGELKDVCSLKDEIGTMLVAANMY